MAIEKNAVELEQESNLFEELDKGIDSMENGRVTPHEESMKIIRENVDAYAI